MSVLLIDNYDSYTFNLYHLIYRVTKVEPVVIRNNQFSWCQLENLLRSIQCIVISPGPGCPKIKEDFGICLDLIAKKDRIPILGICLGHQGIACCFGGEVVEADFPAHGVRSSVFHGNSALFSGIPSPFMAVRYHSLVVMKESTPECLRITAISDDGTVMGLEHKTRPLYGVQFHPESILTDYGYELMRNFITLACPQTLTRSPDAQFQRLFLNQNDSDGPQILFEGFLMGDLNMENLFEELFAIEPYAFWLDSSLNTNESGSFSYMGSLSPAGHALIYHQASGELVIESANQAKSMITTAFFPWLTRNFHTYAGLRNKSTPFNFLGGYVGYVGYEMKAECFAKLYQNETIGPPSRPADRTYNDMPDAFLLYIDRFLVLDHRNKTGFFVCQGRDSEAGDRWIRYMKDKYASLLKRKFTPPAETLSCRNSHESCFQLTHPRLQYMENSRICSRHIRAGDSYELCLTTKAVSRKQVQNLDHAWNLYKNLRHSSPAPFAAYLRLGKHGAVLSSSPERFFKINPKGEMECKPIKGTRKRDSDSYNDDANMDSLSTSLKDRAENLMIVDLIRNDLGRVSVLGTVSVPCLMKVETFRHVHQLVSTVRSVLDQKYTAIDAFIACFPPGSMTGAPKYRSTKILEKLERTPRGVYSGALGFLSIDSAADFSVVIRTAVINSFGELSIGAGGAITILSELEQEYEEMILKLNTVVPL